MTAHRELRMCWESISCAAVCDIMFYVKQGWKKSEQYEKNQQIYLLTHNKNTQVFQDTSLCERLIFTVRFSEKRIMSICRMNKSNPSSTACTWKCKRRASLKRFLPYRRHSARCNTSEDSNIQHHCFYNFKSHVSVCLSSCLLLYYAWGRKYPVTAGVKGFWIVAILIVRHTDLTKI